MAAKPVVKAAKDFPAVCCGVCKYSVNDQGDLLCYAHPPVILTDAEGQHYSIRGAVVEEIDPPCYLFSPKLHA